MQPSSGHQRNQKVIKFAEGFLPFGPESVEPLPHLLKGQNCARDKFTVVSTVRLQLLLRHKFSNISCSAINHGTQKAAVFLEEILKLSQISSKSELEMGLGVVWILGRVTKLYSSC